ncbi:hypothetical protein ACFXJ5_25300 [Streptomyces sp. NPDC059373]
MRETILHPGRAGTLPHHRRPVPAVTFTGNTGRPATRKLGELEAYAS